MEREGWSGVEIDKRGRTLTNKRRRGGYELARRTKGGKSFGAVGRLRVITAAMLLALWVPATWQCLLERAEVVEASDDCCPNSACPNSAPENGADGAGSICCTLADGHFKRNDAPPVDLKPPQPAARVAYTDQGSRRIASAAPETDFRVPWQIEQRAAMPARAPCFAS